MSRTRPKPWLHRFARPLIGGIATIGVLNTGYLTYLRFTATTCPLQTCAVLGSRYATIFGQPLSLFGMLAYLAVALIALAPLLINPETKKAQRHDLEEKTWPLLFAAATGMLVFSLYLMNIMFSEFVFGGAKLGNAGICPFCLFSAISATAIFVITLLGREWDERGPLFSIGAIVSVLTLVTTFALYAPQQVSADMGLIKSGADRVVFAYPTTSGEAEKQLANHLKSTGAVMYGSYTCPHCCEQKLQFGKEAVAEAFPYTECNPTGKNADTDTCKRELNESAKQTGREAGFPTWKINGKYLTGTQTLKVLAQASGYTGSQDFKNAAAKCEPR
jgi:uncharacterized membrane protein